MTPEQEDRLILGAGFECRDSVTGLHFNPCRCPRLGDGGGVGSGQVVTAADLIPLMPGSESTSAQLRNARSELAEVHALVEKIPGRTPVEVLRQVIADGQDARIEVARLRAQLADVRAAATEKVRAVLEAATHTDHAEGAPA